ncbi:MAG TPA: hypothetical protein VFR35_13465 [Actinoplanes sp.]|nr:hypothetical protein [Actinoplanes sp.]
MGNDDLDALRARLAGLTGPARTRTLLELGQRLADRYWRIGPGAREALPYLDEGVAVLDEAYGHFEPGAVTRGRVAALLGWLAGTRYSVHFGAEADRETGIRLLEEALTFPQLPPMLLVVDRMILGQLLLGRLTGALGSADHLRKAMRSGVPPAETANVDRAADCFREVLRDPCATAEIVAAAEPMLAVAEAMQTLSGAFGGGGPGGFDLGRLQQAITALQSLQEKAGTVRVRGGLPPMPGLFEADTIASADPLDRPVAVVDGPAPARAGTAAPPRRPPQPATGAAELRATFRDRLSAAGARPFTALLELLREGAAVPEVGTVDDLVALASALVGVPGHGADDHLLLAAALYLRSQVDGGGWAGDDGDDDRRAAAGSLLAAAESLPGKRSDAVGLAFRLATLLDAKNPSGELRNRLGDGFVKVTGALRAAGADVLVYPQPGAALLLVASTGRFELTPTGTRLPPRILMAGDGTAHDDALVSYVKTGSQVVDLAARPRRMLAEAPVFVANPRGDREHATTEAVLLRRAFYPRSTGLGRVVENAGGAGTVDDVRAHLRASMLHLGCGITAGGELELAGPAQLGLRQISAPSGRLGKAGGLAVLPPGVAGTAALTDALLAANFSRAVGWRSAVPPRLATVAYYLLHFHLVEQRQDLPTALQAVRHWMRDPHRKPPANLPAEYERVAASAELADPAFALVQHGLL